MNKCNYNHSLGTTKHKFYTLLSKEGKRFRKVADLNVEVNDCFSKRSQICDSFLDSNQRRTTFVDYVEKRKVDFQLI